MAVKRIHKVPDELPHAHLFLDDIEEISKILLAAHEPVLAHTKREPRISFVIKDSQMDSIEDLKVRGGSTAELRITVGGGLGPSVEIDGSFNPRIALYGLDDPDRWVVYGKIKSIFERRKLGLKNAITSLPGWLKFLVVLLMSLLPALGLSMMRHGSRIGIWPWVGFAALLAFITFEVFRPSRVFLQPSYERSKDSSAAKRGLARDVALVILGALIGKLVEKAATFVFK